MVLALASGSCSLYTSGARRATACCMARGTTATMTLARFGSARLGSNRRRTHHPTTDIRTHHPTTDFSSSSPRKARMQSPAECMLGNTNGRLQQRETAHKCRSTRTQAKQLSNQRVHFQGLDHFGRRELAVSICIDRGEDGLQLCTSLGPRWRWRIRLPPASHAPGRRPSV